MGFPLQPPRVQMVDQFGNCTREWYLYFLGNRNEAEQATDDGLSSLLGIGAEETKQQVFMLVDEVRQLESINAELREQVARLTTEIESLKQATVWP